MDFLDHLFETEVGQEVRPGPQKTSRERRRPPSGGVFPVVFDEVQVASEVEVGGGGDVLADELKLPLSIGVGGVVQVDVDHGEVLPLPFRGEGEGQNPTREGCREGDDLRFVGTEDPRANDRGDTPYPGGQVGVEVKRARGEEVTKIAVLERVETGLLVQLDVGHSSQGAGIGSLVKLGGEEVLFVGVKATDVVGGQSDRGGGNPPRVTPTHLERGSWGGTLLQKLMTPSLARVSGASADNT